MSSYSTTYVGIVVVLLGWLGVSNLVTNEQVSIIIDNIIQLVGMGVTIYGRYKAGGVTVLGVKK
jgi:hypothetical protein